MKEGIFAVNKPKGISSHDAVNIVRRKTGIKRVGHAGTLDPLAEGVLVIAVGREFTKQLSSIVKTEKEYIAEIFLGQTSTTDDMEGEKTIVDSEIKPTKEEIKTSMQTFIGKIKQTPPAFSAIKINGKSAYKFARQGRTLALKAREVEIKEIEILNYKYPILKLRIVSGKGVYIRALARDLGEKLGTGGYMQSLVRTRVGNYTLDKAVKLED